MAKKPDSLTRYRQKRNFAKTPEPKGIPAAESGNRYLIQKHAASHLHYDFRLELDGALKSWAVPKGPSLDPHDRRLAMEVEDHPVSYGSFEGIIPKGQYGGGTVMLWDTGSWEPVGDPRAGIAKGKLVFKLHGERLRGEWTLVKAFSKDKRGNSWLLIKHNDDEVRIGGNESFLASHATSVATGRTMEEIADDKDKVWKSNHQETPVTKKYAIKTSKAARATKFPKFSPPQLATLSTQMPRGQKWVHEVKFDGYRMLAYIEKGKVRIYSRNGKDWTEAFQPIVDKLSTFKVDNAIIDGEIVVADAKGNSNFSELKEALSQGESDRFQYYVFDLPYFNGQNLTALPLLERKAKLSSLIKANGKKNTQIIYSEHFEAPHNFLQHICSMHLEGVISKCADAPYTSGRSRTWLKTKCQKRQEFVIGGFTLPSTGALGVGALLLGYYDGDQLEYAGRVGTGFTAASSMQIRKKLDKARQKTRPFVSVSTLGAHGAIWVKPQLVGEVEFTEWTPDGHLRHPAFKGLREDKPPKEIVKEVAVSPKAVAADSRKAPTKSRAKSVSDKKNVKVGDIPISHPDRIIYPDSNITKLQLAQYYHAIADHILPYVINRPLSMLRCPEGISEQCFFQRHVGFGHSPYLHEVSVTVKGETREYLQIKDIEGLISLVQWGVIELHPWQCKANNLEKPDRIIFDLDPDPQVTWKQLMKAAQEVQQRMSELGLESFLKTTGGKGLHVAVPITPHYRFAAIKAFARAVAESMAQDTPTSYIATMSKSARKGKIFIDYLRNDVTSTAVSAFSARARVGATVSTPLAWRELTAALKPANFTIETIPLRLAKQKKDPWADFSQVKQKLAAKYLKALKIDAV